MLSQGRVYVDMMFCVSFAGEQRSKVSTKNNKNCTNMKKMRLAITC